MNQSLAISIAKVNLTDRRRTLQGEPLEGATLEQRRQRGERIQEYRDAIAALDAITEFPSVEGNCPMGCGDTLYLGKGGFITCSWHECPNPTAASDVLGENETEHVVVLTEEGWSCKHPLRERIKDELYDCGIGERLQELHESGERELLRPGTYRVSRTGPLAGPKLWKFTRLSEGSITP